MRERVLKGSSGLPPDVGGTIVTVGTFDGVHRGHQDVLRRLVARAHEVSLKSVLVTFDPHPVEVVRPASAPPLLTTLDEKLEVLAESGLDYAAVIPFTPALAQLEADDFVHQVLRSRFHMQELLVGHDHGFGRGRSGGVDVLLALGAAEGFHVEVIPPVSFADEAHVSSTAIRQAIGSGDMRRAAAGLGRPYSVSGRVIPGEQRGRTLGYPTLNLELPPSRKLLPAEGVYAVRAQTPAGSFGGMMNLGPRPTFGDERVSLEVHLFDAAVDLYGRSVRIDFIERLRDTQRFENIAALVEQIGRDAVAARAVLALPDARVGASADDSPSG